MGDKDKRALLQVGRLKKAGTRQLPIQANAWLSASRKLDKAIKDLQAGRPVLLRKLRGKKLYLYLTLTRWKEDSELQAPQTILRLSLRLRRPGSKSDGAVIAAIGRELFERDTRGLRVADQPAVGSSAGIDEAALIGMIRAEVKAGKWKKDNCSNCPWRYLSEGKIKGIAQLRTDKRVKKISSTCKSCPSRPLLAAYDKALKAAK
ncbi:hypothetical protein IT575_09375 [bacterium]|nr:hypothetical protein [bacterium]